MKSKLIQWFAIILVIEIGLIHITLSQAEYEEAVYMGYLFAANFFEALVAAFGIYRNKLWGWMLGLVIAIASIAGYSWSRTLGMPGMEVEEWLTPDGIVAVLLEGAFILLVLFRPWKIPTGGGQPSPGSKLRYMFPVAGLLVIVSISALTYRWDLAATQAFGYHVSSPDKVSKTPVTSIADLEGQYGIQVVQAATSMMDSIVDVRIRIIDTDKAHAILLNQAALFVNQQDIILAPHMHSHPVIRMKAGKIYVVFFPTQQIIQTGSEVSLVLGPVRTEPVIVK
jgi:hypothetical protein